MFLVRPQKRRKRNEMKLVGAIQISNNSFFVCKNRNGVLSLRTGKEEKLQKDIVQRMIELNPSIKRMLKDYKIKPTIDNTKLIKHKAITIIVKR